MVWNLITKHLNPRRNLVAEQLRQLVESGRGNEVPERIPRMDRRHFNNSEHGLWHMLMGQITFRQADYEASLEHFRQGAEICPEVESFELARAQTYFFMERPAEAWACVYRFPVAELDTGWALRLCHYAYLCSDYERGLWLVGILVERYREAVNLDPSHLMERGLPPFSFVWFTSAAFHKLAGRLDSMRRTTQQLERDCFNYDFELAWQDLDAAEHGDYAALLRSVRAIREEQRPLGVPLGFHDVSIAVFQSFMAPSYRQALGILEAVRISEHDFPGLISILRLARARVAHVHGEELQERMMANTFLNEYPMLVPAEVAFQFGLLDYQETLKPRVRWMPQEA
ncbi:hypothetical protein KDL44_04820 [bacterium]|nr:hypothetical protein [bacterium]